MSFFKRKDKGPSIPLPPDEVARPASSQSRNPDAARAELFGSSSSSASPASDPYARRPQSTAPSYASQDPYASKAPRSVESVRAESDPARAALFAGYNPDAIPKQQGRRQYGERGQDGGGDGYGGQQTQAQEDEDEDVESIKRDIRGVKQESLGSTRNALRIARETEETARGTLGRLGDQSERIANTERHLDLAKAASSRADDKTAELKKLNRSIFVPVVTWNKEGKRAENERRITDRHIEETAERQKARLDVEQTNQRLNSRSLGEQRRGPMAGQMAARKEARKQYQFEATASDDELEDELDENLDETLDVTRRLKALAVAAGSEISSHNERLTRINDKAEHLDIKILTNVERLKRIN